MNRLTSVAHRYAGLFAALTYSAANFLLAALLQQQVTVRDFGVFSLVQVFVQLGITLSNGLLCAPIVIALAERVDTSKRIIGSFSRAALVISASFSVLLCTYCLSADLPIAATVSATLYALASWTRWFSRSVEIAEGSTFRPVAGDLLYSLTLVLGAALLFLTDTTSITTALAVQAAGCSLTMVVLTKSGKSLIQPRQRTEVSPFFRSFRRDGKWATVGTITTEATANAHPYVVGILLGPSAFAPIAVSSLVFRLVPIAVQAITQYERPKLASAYVAGDDASFGRTLVDFRKLLLSAWSANAVVAVVVFGPLIDVVSRNAYPINDLRTAAVMLAAVFLVRCLRAGDSAALQATGAFKGLAWASVTSAPIAISGALLSAALIPQLPSLTLIGVLLGEFVMLVAIQRQMLALRANWSNRSA